MTGNAMKDRLGNEASAAHRTIRHYRSRPKILVVGPIPPPHHGVSAVTWNLLNSSLRDDFQLLHLDIADRRSLVNVANLDIRNIWLALRHGLQFCYLLIAERPQLVYVPISERALGFLRDSLFLVPARLTHRAVVVHLHGGSFDGFYRDSPRMLRWLVRFCLKHVDRAVVLGDAFRAIFSGLIPQERVCVVPNGIPGEPYQEHSIPFGAAPRKFRVLYLGNLWQSKGFLDFIHAAPSVLERYPDAEFLLMGDDSFPEAKSAQAWVREHGLGNAVRFLGVRQGADKIEILKGSDVVVFPSRGSEGQPLVLLEAMAAGVPIIATRHATADQTLGENGAFYIRSGDPADLAEKVIVLLGDPNQRSLIAARNRARWEEFFTLEKFVANLRAVLLEALENHGRKAPALATASKSWRNSQ
jgi:glycosyltransferase involved in cell wall biosynthesis